MKCFHRNLFRVKWVDEMKNFTGKTEIKCKFMRCITKRRVRLERPFLRHLVLCLKRGGGKPIDADEWGKKTDCSVRRNTCD